MDSDTDVWTLPEVAAFLRTDSETVQQLLDRGELTGFKVGGEWRVLSAAVLQYLREQMESTRQEALARVITDPRTWARMLGDTPEFRDREFEAGTFGAWVQVAVKAEEAEHSAENVLPFDKPRRD